MTELRFAHRRSGRLPAGRAAGVAVLLAAASTAVGCGDPGVRWEGSRDTLGGVTVVRNPDTPLVSADSVEVRVLWRQDGAGSDRPWERPRWLAASGDRVHVLDTQAHRVHVLDAPTGEQILEFGAEGDGPGEFRRPFGIEIVGDGIAVGNGAGPSVEIYGPDGRHHDRIRLGFLPMLLENLGEGRLWATGLGAGGPTTATLSPGEGTVPWETRDTSVVDPALAFEACPRWGSSRRGLLRAHCRRLAFQRTDGSGEVVAEVHVDRPPVLATEAELDSVEARVRRMTARAGMSAEEARSFVRQRVEEAEIEPVYARIRGDRATNRVYVQEQGPATLEPEPARLHVFAPEGRYLTEIAFDRPWVDFTVLDGRLYSLEEDPTTGLVTLVARRVTVPFSP